MVSGTVPRTSARSHVFKNSTFAAVGGSRPAHLGERIAAEFLHGGGREHPREHCLGHHRACGHHADIAAFVVGVDLVAGGDVDAAQGVQEGRYRLEVDQRPDRFAVAHPAGKTALAVGQMVKPPFGVPARLVMHHGSR